MKNWQCNEPIAPTIMQQTYNTSSNTMNQKHLQCKGKHKGKCKGATQKEMQRNNTKKNAKINGKNKT